MAIKKYKPTTPGRRNMTTTDYSVLSKVEPERSLSNHLNTTLAVTTQAASQFVTTVVVTEQNIV